MRNVLAHAGKHGRRVVSILEAGQRSLREGGRLVTLNGDGKQP